MKVIAPVTIDTATLSASNVPFTDYALWAVGTTYARGARVLRTGETQIFESLFAGNLGNDPATDEVNWTAVGAANRFRMFDEALGSATSRLDRVEVTLATGVLTDTVAVLDTDAATVRVQVKVGASTLFDQTRTPDPDRPDAFLFLGLPTNAAAQIIVTAAAVNSSTSVSVGTLVAGPMRDLGITEAGPSVSITDFSRRSTDDFGVTSVVPRGWAKRMTVRALIPTAEVDRVQADLADLRAQASLWIGQEEYDCLTVYGFYKDFSVDVATPAVSYCSITVEGLTEAVQLVPPAQSGIAAILTNESHTLPADADGDVISYAGASGIFRVYSGTIDVTDFFGLSTQDNPQALAVTYTGMAYEVTGGLDAGEASATLLIRATGTGPFSGLTIDKAFSLVKSGVGAPGAPGDPGAPAKLLTLISDRQTISYNPAGAPSPSVQTTAFSTNKQGTSATVNWSITDANGTARTPVTDYLSAATGDGVTMSASQFNSARNGTEGVIVTSSLTDGGVTIFDKISVIRVKEGAKGDQGDQGDAAFQLVASGGAAAVSLSIYRTAAASGAWDQQVYSAEGFGGGARVAFRVENDGAVVGGFMCGLNTDPASNADWTSLDYAIYCEGNTGRIYVTNNGAFVYDSGTGVYSAGDRFAVVYNGFLVTYLRNDAPFYSQGAADGLKLFIDSSMYFPGLRFTLLDWSPIQDPRLLSGLNPDGSVKGGKVDYPSFVVNTLGYRGSVGGNYGLGSPSGGGNYYSGVVTVANIYLTPRHEVYLFGFVDGQSYGAGYTIAGIELLMNVGAGWQSFTCYLPNGTYQASYAHAVEPDPFAFARGGGTGESFDFRLPTHTGWATLGLRGFVGGDSIALTDSYSTLKVRSG